MFDLYTEFLFQKDTTKNDKGDKGKNVENPGSLIEEYRRSGTQMDWTPVTGILTSKILMKGAQFKKFYNQNPNFSIKVGLDSIVTPGNQAEFIKTIYFQQGFAVFEKSDLRFHNH